MALYNFGWNLGGNHFGNASGIHANTQAGDPVYVQHGALNVVNKNEVGKVGATYFNGLDTPNAMGYSSQDTPYAMGYSSQDTPNAMVYSSQDTPKATVYSNLDNAPEVIVAEEEENTVAENYPVDRFRMLGFILCVLAALSIGCGITNVVDTVYNVIVPSTSWGCLDSANPHYSDLGPSSQSMQVAIWFWISVGIWAPISVFIAGLLAGTLLDPSSSQASSFLILGILCLIIFIPITVILTIIDAVMSAYCIQTTTSPQPIKFAMPIIVCLLALIEAILLIVLLVELCAIRRARRMTPVRLVGKVPTRATIPAPALVPAPARVVVPAPAPVVVPAPAFAPAPVPVQVVSSDVPTPVYIVPGPAPAPVPAPIVRPAIPMQNPYSPSPPPYYPYPNKDVIYRRVPYDYPSSPQRYVPQKMFLSPLQYPRNPYQGFSPGNYGNLSPSGIYNPTSGSYGPNPAYNYYR